MFSGFCARFGCFFRRPRPGLDPGSRLETEEPDEPPLDPDRAETEPVEPHDWPWRCTPGLVTGWLGFEGRRAPGFSGIRLAGLFRGSFASLGGSRLLGTASLLSDLSLCPTNLRGKLGGLVGLIAGPGPGLLDDMAAQSVLAKSKGHQS